jgi:hypothetical protein
VPKIAWQRTSSRRTGISKKYAAKNVSTSRSPTLKKAKIKIPLKITFVFLDVFWESCNYTLRTISVQSLLRITIGGHR